MTTIQQPLLMVDTGLQPGSIQQVAQSNLVAGIGINHATSSTDVNGLKTLVCDYTDSNGVFAALGYGEMYGNDSVGNPNAGGANPNPLWVAMAGSNNNGVNWTQTIMTSINDHDEDGFNQGLNGPSGHSIHHFDWNRDTTNPRYWCSAGWWKWHDTTPGNSSNPQIITSTDCKSWSRVAVPHYGTTTINQMCVPGYGNGRLIALNDRTGSVNISSNNGSSWGGWTNAGFPLQGTGGVEYFKISSDNNNNWMCTARNGMIAWSTDNGSSWSGTTGSSSPYTYYYPRLGNNTYQNERPSMLRWFPDLYGGCWVWLGCRFTGAYNSTVCPIMLYSTNMSSWTTLVASTNGSSVGLPSDMRSSGFGTYWGGGEIIQAGNWYCMWVQRDTSVVSSSKPSPWELWASKDNLESWQKLGDSPFHDGSGTLYNYAAPIQMRYHPLTKRLLFATTAHGKSPSVGGGQVGYVDFT